MTLVELPDGRTLNLEQVCYAEMKSAGLNLCFPMYNVVVRDLRCALKIAKILRAKTCIRQLKTLIKEAKRKK